MAAVSIAGLFVGFAGGVLFGSFIIKNDVERTGELYIRWTGISVYMCGIVFAIIWNIFFTYDKRGFYSEDSWSQCTVLPLSIFVWKDRIPTTSQHTSRE
jgi:hypothetical protein